MNAKSRNTLTANDVIYLHEEAFDILSALKPRRFWDHQRLLAEASLTSFPP
jgi:hypothetical protein